MFEEKVPMTTLSKRLGLSYWQLRRLRSLQGKPADEALARYKSRRKFKRLHQRARARVRKLLEEATEPI